MQNLSILNKEIKIHNGLFSLNDLHKASGGAEKHKPTRFMRLDGTTELIAEIEGENISKNNQSTDMVFDESQSTDMHTAVKTIRGGKMPGTYVCKELVYHYAMWISAKFSLLVIRTFDRLQNQQQAKLESPYIEGKPLNHIKSGVKRIVNQTGKSYQTVYGGLNQMFGAPNINQIEKGYYEAVCIYLDIPTDFTVPADTMPQSLRQANSDSHIEGLAILSKGARVQAVQAEKLQEALAKFNHATLLLNEAIRCCGAVASGFSEAKPRLNSTAEERQKAAVRTTEMFESWESKQFFS